MWLARTVLLATEGRQCVRSCSEAASRNAVYRWLECFRAERVEALPSDNTRLSRIPPLPKQGAPTYGGPDNDRPARRADPLDGRNNGQGDLA